MKRRIKLLPVKLIYVNPKNKEPHFRRQHYKPKDDKFISDILLIPKDLHNKIRNKLEEIGIDTKKVYYVGGIVRDSLLYKLGYIDKRPKINDIDLVIEKPTEEDIKKLEEHLEKTGKDFPVFRTKIGDKEIEIALARKEKKIGKGYKGFEVITSPDITIEDDLKRRDLTINALAVSLENPEKLIDPYGGLEDLKKGKIRHISLAFKEDPLRVLRVARFSSRFDFKVDNSTIELMKSLKDELHTLTPERVRDELIKTIKQSSNNLSKFFNVLDRANVLDVLFPKIKELQNYKIENSDKTFYDKTMEIVNTLNKDFGDIDLVLSSLFYKYSEILNEKSKSDKHKLRKLIDKFVEELKERYKFRNSTLKLLKDILLYYNDLKKLNELPLGQAFTIVEKLYKDNTLDKILLLLKVDTNNTKSYSEILNLVNNIKLVLNLEKPKSLLQELKKKDYKHNPERIRKLIMNFYLSKLRELLKEDND